MTGRNLWVLLLLSSALVALLTACQQSTVPTATAQPLAQVTPTVDKADPVQPFSDGPRLAVDEKGLDFGAVPVSKAVEAVLHLKNVGATTLEFGEPIVRVVEGCCPPKASLGATALWPGQSTTMTMRFTMGETMTGPHAFVATIKSNDPVEPEKQVIIKIHFQSPN